jgi:molybdate-binding protein/DNA-binding XRE family transcriptional regulator
MTEISQPDGTRLRLARQARGLSQQQLAGVAGVTRQAVSAVESGHSDPSLRVALALARALGVTVEELFGPGDLGDPVLARPVAAVSGQGSRVALATVGDTFVALPLHTDMAARLGFGPAGGLVAGVTAASGATGGGPAAARSAAGGVVAGPEGAPARRTEPWHLVPVRPIGPPRPTVVVAGCDPALPLLETPLGLLDPPLAFAWWPCGSGEALRLAAAGLVHAAGVHRVGPGDPGNSADPGESAGAATDTEAVADIPGGADVVGFASWREGLVVRPGAQVRGLGDVAGQQLRLVNREPGAQARTLLDRERQRLGLSPAELPGYDSRVAGHLQVAAAIVGGLADAGVSSEPAALAYGLDFIPLASERFDLVLPAKHAASREVQGLLKVLTSPWLLAQLASLPGYDAARCGERASLLVAVNISGRKPGSSGPGRWCGSAG